jgi:hypothetical protein
MALNFKKYERKGALKEEGIVADLIPNGQIRFVPGTIDRYRMKAIKAMAVVLIKENGDSDSAPLSKMVSSKILAALDNGTSKKDVLAAISKLMVLETETGTSVISAPVDATGAEEAFEIASAVSNKTTYADLVLF